MNPPRFHTLHLARVCTGLLLALAVGLLGAERAGAQSELLPLDHPATRLLIRLDHYGVIPHFPAEHLPLSRRAAVRFLREAAAHATLPNRLQRSIQWYLQELTVDDGAPVDVIFRTERMQSQLGAAPLQNRSWAIVDHRDTSLGIHVALLPVLDGELRVDPERSERSLILQGGLDVRGTALRYIGFGARVTNGTILGDSLLPLRDPRYAQSGKFGVLGFGRDVDFGRGHLRADLGPIAVGIGREALELGVGGETNLLLGSALPSFTDWIRLRASIGPVDFSHVHASLLAEPLNGVGAGILASIPTKYIAAHAVSVGPFAGVRLTLGESLVYSGRPIEIGYLNPLNFLKSQEHYLRDRDNSNMYAGVAVDPIDGVHLEGEFLLDDLQFSLIGDGFWANKTAWRTSASVTGLLDGLADLGLEYLRLEPYVYSHFNPSNAHTHDATTLAAGGLEPNSDALRGRIGIHPLPNLSVHLGAGYVRHGANETAFDPALGRDTLVRNVGGDVRLTNDSGRDSPTVEFLDGVAESTLNLTFDLLYEPYRNVYLRLRGGRSRLSVDGVSAGTDTQLWLGVRIGAF